jgi:hypothetical protein
VKIRTVDEASHQGCSKEDECHGKINTLYCVDMRRGKKPRW